MLIFICISKLPTQPHRHVQYKAEAQFSPALDLMSKKELLQDFSITIKKSMNISTFIKQLRNSPDLRPQIKYHHYVPPHEPILLDEIPLSSEIRKILKAYKVEKLYSHQVKAIKTLQEGKDIVVSTPTASGKSFIYNLPIIEKIIRNKKREAFIYFL